MATLITGSGLIGASFGQYAAARGERLVFVDFQPRHEYLKSKLGSADYVSLQGDVLDLPALAGIIRDQGVDTVVHTAAIIAGRVAREGYWAFNVNIQGTINIAEAVRLAGVKRVVHISTLSVYNRAFEGSASSVPETLQRGDSTAYGNSKAVQELVLEAYSRLYGFELMVVRLAHVFGLGHFLGGAESGAITHTLLTRGREGGLARIARAPGPAAGAHLRQGRGPGGGPRGHRAGAAGQRVQHRHGFGYDLSTNWWTRPEPSIRTSRWRWCRTGRRTKGRRGLSTCLDEPGNTWAGNRGSTLGSALRDYVEDLDALESSR